MTTPLLDDTERWQAAQNRDRRYDGRFVTAVRTTGIYCRPSCAARPHRKNVTFYDTPQQAEAAGYRACKRCKPDQVGTQSPMVRGGKGTTIHYVVEACSMGYVLVGKTERGVCSVMLGDSPGQVIEALHDEYPAAQISPAPDGLREPLDAVLRALNGDPARIDLPLDIHATVFQHQVWDALRQIPSGETRTYTQVAREIGKPDAVRAVASACAANQVALVIPCHRVIREDGTLGGFKWGLPRKQALLDQERMVEQFSQPV